LGDDGSMIVTVTDSGAGMDEEAVVRALLMFGRANSMVAAEDEGPGLGLPLAKSLVEAHGGVLEIESEPGAGTTVILRFPAERVIPENRPNCR
jgi:signal transduction histidine kinase